MINVPDYFRDANDLLVAYDGSPVHWRVSAYGILIISDSVLLAKQTDEKYYDLPGGGVELDETIEEALVREGLEETGWRLRPVAQITQITNFFYHAQEKAFYKTLQQYWSVTGEDSLLPPTDSRVEEVRFQPLTQLSEIDIFANALTAIAQFS